MDSKETLIQNIDKVHTTELGEKRIAKNLKISQENIVEFCIDKITDEKSEVEVKGKNYYIINGSIKLTVNRSSFTIITAHLI